MQDERGTELSVGQDVEIHPASDLFMQGVRHGRIEKVGTVHVHVKATGVVGNGKVFKLSPNNVIVA